MGAENLHTNNRGLGPQQAKTKPLMVSDFQGDGCQSLRWLIRVSFLMALRLTQGLGVEGEREEGKEKGCTDKSWNILEKWK